MNKLSDYNVASDDVITRPPFKETISAGVALLTKREKFHGVLIALTSVVVALLEIAGIGSVLPLVSVIVDPELIESSIWLIRVHEGLGAPSIDKFVTMLAAGSIGILALGLCANLGLKSITNSYSRRAQTRLAQNLMALCLQAPYSWFLDQDSAKLVRMFYTDLSLWGRGFVLRIMTFINNVITVVLIGILIFVATSNLGLLVLAVTGILAIVLFMAVKPILVNLSAIKRRSSDEIVMATTKAVRGIKDIKLSGRNGYFVNKYELAYGASAKAHAHRDVWQQIPPNLGLFIGQGCLIAIAYVLWASGKTGGDIASHIALFVVAFSRAVPAINRISSGFSQLLDVLPFVAGLVQFKKGIQKYADAIESRNVTVSLIPTDWQSLDFENIDFTHTGSSEKNIKGISFKIQRGKSYAFVGPSGAGKSTLIDIILGLQSPEGGQIKVDGEEIELFGRADWYQRIGYVPQSPYTGDDSVRSNIAFGVPENEVDDEHVWRCLKSAHLDEFVRDLPQGIDTRFGDDAVRISGGQRQRLAIARALYNNPDVLILDEATNALDPISERAIKASFESLRNKITIITIAHRLDTIRNFDHIHFLDHGEIIDHGDFNSLQESCEPFRIMFAVNNETETATNTEAG